MDYTAARRKMVDGQIRANRVTDAAVVDAMRAVPREVFVPKAVRALAYADEEVGLGQGRWLMEPMVMARLLQEAAVRAGEAMLVIGDASGYVTAVAARIAGSVVALECDAEMAARATAAINEVGVDNAAVVQGDLAEGLPAQAPFDVILFAGAVDEIPPAVCRQLADGGRLAAIVDAGGTGHGTVVLRVGDAFGRRVSFDASCPRLPGFEPKPKFVF